MIASYDQTLWGTDGSFFCRRSNCLSDLRHDEEEGSSIRNRFCPGSAPNLPGSALVFQNQPKPGARSDRERAATGAHTDFHCVWRDPFLYRTGTVWCHENATVVARRCFWESSGTTDDCWLVVYLPDRGSQRIRYACCLGGSNTGWVGISPTPGCRPVYHHERG